MSVKAVVRFFVAILVWLVACGPASAELCDAASAIPLPEVTWLKGNGFAYRADIPVLAKLSNSNGNIHRSPLVLCEDGRVLDQRDTTIDKIVNLGGGRWDHFGPSIWFSSTDGSNPITNGKRYAIDSDKVDLRAYIARQAPDLKFAILVLLPTILTIAAFGFLVVRLWRLGNGAFPLVDLGFWAAGTATAYLSIASILYLLSGMKWTLRSDRRMFRIFPAPDEVAHHLWWGLAYVTVLSIAYLLSVRKTYPATPIRSNDLSYGVAFALIVAAAAAWKAAIEFRYGISVVQTNAVINTDPWTAHVPLLIAQITQHSFGILNLAKIALVIWLVTRFNQPWAKAALLVWLPVELAMTITVAGARTYFASLVIAAVLAYHLRQRPFGIWPLAAISSAIIVGLLGYGCWRGGSCSFDANTEFQTILANPIYLDFLISDGQVTSVPSGVRAAELLQFIPQQLSPFTKMEPADWLGQVSSTAGTGTAFGVMAQSVAGLGFPELLGRGVLLGLALALIHNLCLKTTSHPLTTVFYIWLCLTIYYAYRVGTFYWISFVIFRFVPFAAAAWVLAKLVGLVPKHGR